MIVLEDVGKAVGDDWQDTPLATRYVERTVLPPKSNSVRLIDFEGARFVGTDAGAWEGSSVRAYLEREGNAILNGREGAFARQAC